ncbi:hypothetical protein FRX31_023657 [Thalictrum thalictroides]|uniref:Uncharacterized protein n=1 Tax=Thalictrum thalictroides TaxID=46969 RepID=A0A7J6VNS6_THATH|nr:hypothetical protein FRX31_023657 [Thalictrum thalictroides]
MSESATDSQNPSDRDDVVEESDASAYGEVTVSNNDDEIEVSSVNADDVDGGSAAARQEKKKAVEKVDPINIKKFASLSWSDKRRLLPELAKWFQEPKVKKIKKSDMAPPKKNATDSVKANASSKNEVILKADVDRIDKRLIEDDDGDLTHNIYKMKVVRKNNYLILMEVVKQ